MTYPFTYTLKQEIELAPGVTVGDDIELDCSLDLESNGGDFYVVAIRIEGFTKNEAGCTVKSVAAITRKHPLWSKIADAAYECDDLQGRWEEGSNQPFFSPAQEWGTPQAKAL